MIVGDCGDDDIRGSGADASNDDVYSLRSWILWFDHDFLLSHDEILTTENEIQIFSDEFDISGPYYGENVRKKQFAAHEQHSVTKRAIIFSLSWQGPHIGT